MSKSPKNTAKSVKAITTKKVGDVIVNRGRGLKPPKFKATAYKLASTIDDSMIGAATSGKAGAGQIVAVWNNKYFALKKLPNGRTYNPTKDYFTAPSEDEKDDNGKVIRQSRKSIQDYFLSHNSPRYKSTLAEFMSLTHKLDEAQKAKNAFDVSDYTFKLGPYKTKILAARGMLHRTMTALAHLYNVQAQAVQFGVNNAIKVDCLPNKDGSKNKHTGLFNATQITSNGNAFLIAEKWVNVRGTNGNSAATANGSVTEIKPPAVDATSAKSVMNQLEKLFISDKFNPKTVASEKRKDIEVDKYSQASFALTCIGDIKPQDMREDSLREIMCKLFIDAGRILGMRTVSDAQKGVNAETIKKVA